MRKSTIRFIGYCVAIVYTIYMFTGGLMPTQAEVDAQVKQEEKTKKIEEERNYYEKHVMYKMELVSLSDSNGIEIPKHSRKGDKEGYSHVYYSHPDEWPVLKAVIQVDVSEDAKEGTTLEDFDPNHLINFDSDLPNYKTGFNVDIVEFDKSTGYIEADITFNASTTRGIEVFRMGFTNVNQRFEKPMTSQKFVRFSDYKLKMPAGVIPVEEISEYID